MNNLFGGRGNVALAITTKDFSTLGFDGTNINIVFEIGPALLSWVPDRLINSVMGITAGKGYWIVPKIDIDYSNDLFTDITQAIILGGSISGNVITN